MSECTLAHWMMLHSVPAMGPVTFRRLLDRFGNPAEALEASEEDLAQVRGMTRETAQGMSAARGKSDWAARMVHNLNSRGVRILKISDADYPAPLLDLVNPPPLLFMFGAFTPADASSVSIVGTTKPSERGRPIAEGFGARFASEGITVVSGYAHGIDAAGHRGAFNAGGRSILCVPYGIRKYRSRPDFPSLAEISRRGAVISECPPDQEWNAPAAVARDRIIAALGRVTLVIETRPRGGTMHTVQAAEQLGRPVFALKYGRPPESARGNSILVARGAKPVTAFKDIAEILPFVKCA